MLQIHLPPHSTDLRKLSFFTSRLKSLWKSIFGLTPTEFWIRHCVRAFIFFISQGPRSKKAKEDDLLESIKRALDREDADEAFGRNVAHWLKCVQPDKKEDLKMSIHVLCYNAIKDASTVPSIDVETADRQFNM